MVKASVIEPNDNELPAKPTQRTGEPEATRASQRSGMIEAEHRSPWALQSRISSPRLPYPQATITLQKKSWRSSSIRAKGILRNVIRAISFSPPKAGIRRHRSV